MTTDDLKLQRDGHLEYGRIRSRDHKWVEPIHYVVAVNATSVFTAFDGGPGVIEWRRPND